MLDPQLWWSVVETGCFFGLMALAYFVNLTGAGFFNFALGADAVASALGASWLVQDHGFSTWTACIVMIIVAMLLAVVTELLIVRPVQARSGGGELPALVAVSATLFAIVQLAGQFFGVLPRQGVAPWTTGTFTVGSAVVDRITVPLIVVTVVIFTLCALAMRLTPQGRLIRAIGDRLEAAHVLGMPVARARLLSFVLAAFIAAVAGIMFSAKGGVSSNLALQWTLTGFLALVVGGTGSVWAPLLGGMLLAVAQIFIPFYFGGAWLAYSLLIVGLVFFAFRPQGIFTSSVRI